MATYEIELEDGSKYQVDTEDEAPSSQDLDTSTIPSPAEPEGGYFSRFADRLTDPDNIASKTKGAFAAIPGAFKSAMGVLGELPENISNIAEDPIGSIRNNGVKALGAAGSAAARMNPFFSITGPGYDKLLQWADPESFPPTSPEQDADKVFGETLMGAVPIVGSAFARDLGRAGKTLGKGLKSKLTETIIPERFKTFDETITPALLDKSMRLSKGQASRLEDAAGRNRDILDLPPKESYEAYVARLKTAGKEIGDLTDAAPPIDPSVPAGMEDYTRIKPGRDTGVFDPSTGKNFMTPDEAITSSVPVPAQYKIDTPKADKLIADWPSPEDQSKLIEMLNEKRSALEQSFGGNVTKLQNRKTAAQTDASALYNKEGGAKSPMEQKLDAAFAEDLRNAVTRSVDRDAYNAATGTYSDMKAIGPIASRRAAAAKLNRNIVPEERIPGPWQGNVEKLAKALSPVLSTPVSRGAAAIGGGISQALGQTAGGIGRLSGAIGEGAGAVGSLMTSRAAGPLVGEAVASTLLPRDTDNLNSDSLAQFLMLTAQTPQATIAQGLVKNIKKAQHAEDLDTVEKLHADMARLFPDLFEPGQGVNGKLFHPDDQAKAMENLKQLNRLGVVDNHHLAEQQSAFNNLQDGRILPFSPPSNSRMTPKNGWQNGARTYPY